MFKDLEWRAWFSKIKWQLISFKFLSFWVSIGLLIAAWVSLFNIFEYTVRVAIDLHEKDYISGAELTDIINHSQSIMFNSALSHVLVLSGAILASIVAIRGVSYYTESKTTCEALKKVESNKPKSTEDLKKFLYPRGN